MKKPTPGPSRKIFLAGVALGGVSGAVTSSPAAAQPGSPPAKDAPSPADATRAAARESAAESSPPITVRDACSDFMVDVLKSLDLDYVASNPGSSFRGIHESLINYGNNVKPEFITCTHEEVAVALAHGYAKVANKPMLALVHSNVGLQHASMALYNAWADRAPVFVLAGNALDAAMRRPGAEWQHSANDLSAIVSGSIKWYDQPASATHYAESTVRAYRIAVTPPMGPVLISLDGELQERSITSLKSGLRVPAYHAPVPPSGDPQALAQAARMLVNAQHPVIVADRAVRTQAGLATMVALAEALGAPVIDEANRLNFPTSHWACTLGTSTGVVREADVLLFLEVDDPFGTLYRFSDQVERKANRIAPADARVITLGVDEYSARGNEQDVQRFVAADLPIIGDPETSLPTLLAAVHAALDGAARGRIAQRTEQLKAAHDKARAAAQSAARYAWDASPLTTGRVTLELGEVLRNDDWALVSGVRFFSNWPLRLWDFNKTYQYNGRNGAAGEGYGAPAAVGAALAHRGHGRIPVAIQNDGDMMYQPGAFWTAAHHRIPLLAVMHNNRSYHQEVMHVQRMANRRQRGISRAHIGTTLSDPDINFATLAKSLGVWSAGPISDPAALRPALERAVAMVRRGEPALIDVRTQPR